MKRQTPKRTNKSSLRNLRPATTDRAGNALVVLSVIAVLGVVYISRPVLFPIVLAVLMTFAFRPVIRYLTGRIRLPVILASGLVVTAILAAAVAVIYFLSAPASKWLADAPDQFEKIEQKMRPVKESVEEISDAAGKLEGIAEAIEDNEKLTVEVARPTLTTTVLNATTEFILGGGITLSCLFLFLAYGDDLLKRYAEVAGQRGRGQNLLHFFAMAEQTISKYLLTFAIINLGLGTIIALLLWIMGMPNPLLWGAMAACLNFIPYIGLITGASIVFFVALVSFDSVLYAAIAPAIYLGVNLLEANFVTPAILGKAMSVHIIFLFLGIILLGWLWGIGGVLIAVPLMATMRVICEHVEALKPIARFLGAPANCKTSSLENGAVVREAGGI